MGASRTHSPPPAPSAGGRSRCQERTPLLLVPPYVSTPYTSPPRSPVTSRCPSPRLRGINPATTTDYASIDIPPPTTSQQQQHQQHQQPQKQIRDLAITWSRPVTPSPCSSRPSSIYNEPLCSPTASTNPDKRRRNHSCNSTNSYTSISKGGSNSSNSSKKKRADLIRLLFLAGAVGFVLAAGQVASVQFMLRKVCQQYYSEVQTSSEVENMTCQAPAVQAEIAKWTTLSTLAQFVPVIITSTCVGAISDTYGRKPMILTMLLGGAILFGNAALIDIFGLSVRWLTANMALAALLGEGSLLGQLHASVSDLTEGESNRAMAFGGMQAAVLAGAVSGSFISGILADQTSIRTVFISMSAMAILTFFFTLFFVRETAPTIGLAKVTPPTGFGELIKCIISPLQLLLQTRTLRLFSVAYLCQCLIVCTFDQFSIIYATYRWSWGTIETGALYSAQYVGKMLVVVIGLPLLLKVAERAATSSPSPSSAVPTKYESSQSQRHRSGKLHRSASYQNQAQLNKQPSVPSSSSSSSLTSSRRQNQSVHQQARNQSQIQYPQQQQKHHKHGGANHHRHHSQVPKSHQAQQVYKHQQQSQQHPHNHHYQPYPDVEIVAAGCAEGPRTRDFAYDPAFDRCCPAAEASASAGVGCCSATKASLSPTSRPPSAMLVRNSNEKWDEEKLKLLDGSEDAKQEPDCRSELFVVRFAWICTIAAYICIGLARTSKEFFGTCILATITSISTAPLRSLFSSQTPAAQQATLFSALGLISQLTDLVAPFLIQTVYPVSVSSGYPQALYFVLAVGMLASLIFTLRGEPSSSSSGDQTIGDLEQAMYFGGGGGKAAAEGRRSSKAAWVGRAVMSAPASRYVSPCTSAAPSRPSSRAASPSGRCGK